MSWQNPMQNTQEKGTHRNILNILTALGNELTGRNIDWRRKDLTTFVINGEEFTVSDMLSDTQNGVCYLISEFNEMIECTQSRVSECVDTILGMMDVQVDKSFQTAYDMLRNKYH